MDEQQLKKWKLILGDKSDPEEQLSLDEVEQGMSDVLDALYDSEKDRGLGASSPNVNRWLGDIRKYFPATSVQLLQKDALDRLGLEEMLMEPELLETIDADVELASTLLSLNKVMPIKTRESARIVVQKVVDALLRKLRSPLQTALRGSLNKASRKLRPKMHEVDWPRTILANLKHYQKEYQSIVPEKLIGFGKRRRQLKHIILLVDQSGSMASSMVYAAVSGAVIASLPSLRTNMVVFDTSVVDLTDYLHDPVELLFATQLGGGTHIDKALQYTQGLIVNPQETILVLISDLMEGGNEQSLLKNVASLKTSGVQMISLLALSDKGTPVYDRSIASKVNALDVPVFGCTPDLFPELMAAAINQEDLRNWASRHGLATKS
ncbi:MAG TPA: VWA domain-containing protein [Saprospiraceae bacterium]|nr:VWA domain-containing protein [Saprospiraceae bacterium]